jgi:hypothetical protein
MKTSALTVSNYENKHLRTPHDHLKNLNTKGNCDSRLVLKMGSFSHAG